MASKIIKGEDSLISFTVRDSEKYPLDLTGKVIKVKSKINGVLTTFESPEVLIVNAVHGKVQLKLNDPITEQLKPGFFDFDVYIDPDTSMTRIVRVIGKIPVEDRQR
jgi:hypothetical protein